MNTFHCPRILLRFASLYTAHSPEMPILPSFPEQHCFMLYQGTAAIRQEFSNQTSIFISSVQFSHSVVPDSLRPHELQHTRHPCPSPAPGACSNSCPSSQWGHPTISSSVVPFSSFWIFPSIRVFSNELALCIRWSKYWASASASVLPMNIQDWFPLGLIGWISLQSKGLSRVFSNTTVQKHQCFRTQLSL